MLLHPAVGLPNQGLGRLGQNIGRDGYHCRPKNPHPCLPVSAPALLCQEFSRFLYYRSFHIESLLKRPCPPPWRASLPRRYPGAYAVRSHYPISFLKHANFLSLSSVYNVQSKLATQQISFTKFLEKFKKHKIGLIKCNIGIPPVIIYSIADVPSKDASKLFCFSHFLFFILPNFNVFLTRRS